ncbi:MAG: hypothetical protein AAB926_01385 [Patescibacteria group bacterium]
MSKKKYRIKCVNCGYIGEGQKGRSKWAVVLAWIIVPLAPLITIIYFLATHKWFCPECKSKFVEEIDETGKIVKSKRTLLIIASVLVILVIVIIAISASLVLTSLNSAQGKARDARRISDINQIRIGLEMYRDESGSYPSVLDQSLSKYIPNMPIDPEKNAPYEYQVQSGGKDYQLCAKLEAGQEKCVTSKF